VREHLLRNNKGLVAKFSNYGARWLSMTVPDAKGDFADVLLGFDRIDDYLTASEQYFGATVGRVCGRIKQACCKIDGQDVVLAKNDVFGFPEKNHLHGGIDGFHRKIWDSALGTNEKNEPFVEYSRLSPDGEEGYPGNLEVKVRYTLGDNAVVYDCQAFTDRTTIVNLTNHAFFNLSGNPAEPVFDHFLTIFASKYIECDDQFIPTGKILAVKGSPFDFSEKQVVGRNRNGFSTAFALDGGKAAYLFDSKTRRSLTITTNQPSIQAYNGFLLDGKDIGKNDIPYCAGAGIALEPQGFPDAPNHSAFPSIILKKGELYHHLSVYTFGID